MLLFNHKYYSENSSVLFFVVVLRLAGKYLESVIHAGLHSRTARSGCRNQDPNFGPAHVLFSWRTGLSCPCGFGRLLVTDTSCR